MANARRAEDQRKIAWRRRGSLLVLALGLLLAGCAGGGGGLGGGGDNAVSLGSVPWCDRPFLSFQDVTANKTLTDWSAVKDQLGFTPYLPPTLPKGSCLAFAGGSIHDSIFSKDSQADGGKLNITYVLPQSGALAFSEAPRRGNMTEDLQCISSAVPGATPTSASSTPTATPGAGTPTATPQPPTPTICQGIMQDTSITIVGRQPSSDLKTLFGNLESNVAWVPTTSLHPVTPSPSSSPSATAASS